MPVYEFYCRDCHSLFNFLSRRGSTDKRPDCPRCGHPQLERQVSVFAISKNRQEAPEDGLPDLDESKMEQAMAALAGEMAGADENDPRQMARLMRKMSEAAGMDFGAGMEEAIRRLEGGEDPEKIEEDLGDVFAADNPFSPEGIKGLRRKYTPPAHDDTLYSLD
jgi:putative FmdB family regulatory protein